MWTVAISTPKAEFEAAKDLIAQGFDVFLPYTIEKSRARVRTRGRALFKCVTAQVARWPRYIFVEAENPKSRFIQGLVSFGGEPAMVPDKLIDQLRRDCDPTGRIVKRSSLFTVGDILRFTEPSPFAGRSGEVLSLGDTTVRVQVDRLIVTSPYSEVA